MKVHLDEMLPIGTRELARWAGPLRPLEQHRQELEDPRDPEHLIRIKYLEPAKVRA